jgi:hypothetical protein
MLKKASGNTLVNWFSKDPKNPSATGAVLKIFIKQLYFHS